MAFDTKMERRAIEGAIKALARGLVEVDGWVWVRRFLHHQKNEPLNPSNPSHRQIIRLIDAQVERFSASREFNQFIAPYKGLVRPIGKGKGTSSSLKEVQEKTFFLKPTLEEAIAYGTEVGMETKRVRGWYDYNEACGWVLGKNALPMHNWKASIRSWKDNQPSRSSGTNGSDKPKVKFPLMSPPIRGSDA